MSPSLIRAFGLGGSLDKRMKVESAILPLGGGPSTGGYKGYGLSVMIDVFAGMLLWDRDRVVAQIEYGAPIDPSPGEPAAVLQQIAQGLNSLDPGLARLR